MITVTINAAYVRVRVIVRREIGIIKIAHTSKITKIEAREENILKVKDVPSSLQRFSHHIS